ncbi:MAG: AAA family ATPase [Planctomycetaceae bacterium]|nr:AAA family ATPase [Planctomycetaceae bacterium]
MRIESIGFRGFPPFTDGAIDFPEKPESGLAEVHVLTGQNGTGKTRLLSILGAACGNAGDLNRRQTISNDCDAYVRASAFSVHGIFRARTQQTVWKRSSEEAESAWRKLITNGRLDGGMAGSPNVLAFPKINATDPPHVSAQAYRGTGRITETPIVAFDTVKVGQPATFVSLERPKDDDALICQSMANLKLSAAMEGQAGLAPTESRSQKITQRFEAAVAQITGRSFTFQVMSHPTVHLVALWGGVQMKLDALPDGLRSIVAWLIACIAKLDAQYPDHPDPLDIPLILLLDEPESHLHPAWQRKLIPAAQQLFPNGQFFVVTHSPFVISSINSGWIHVLRADAAGLVTADAPIPCSKGDTYIDVVEDILGVREWYDPETESLLAEFRSLRNRVVEGNAAMEELERKAENISARSDSLREMMSRELRQIQRNLVKDVVTQ